MERLSGRQKTVGALLIGYLIAIAIDPLITVMRLNVENWANANGYGTIYSWPILAQAGRIMMAIWDALTGSWGLGVICGMVALTAWEAIRKPARLEVRPSKLGLAMGSPPDAQRSDSGETTYLGDDMSLDALVKLSLDKPSMEARQVLKHYEGRRLVVTGRYEDVDVMEGGRLVVRIAVPSQFVREGIEVTGDLTKHDQRAIICEKGERVSLDGVISYLGSGYVFLRDCEIVEIPIAKAVSPPLLSPPSTETETQP